jgi:hypothetical protein
MTPEPTVTKDAIMTAAIAAYVGGTLNPALARLGYRAVKADNQRADGAEPRRYPCPECAFTGATPQAVGAHRRYHHPGRAR